MNKLTLFFLPILYAAATYAQPQIQNWENGNKKSEENFKNGMQEGKSSYWYQNGKLAKEANYKGGKEEGPLPRRDASSPEDPAECLNLSRL